jgi:predicted cation transporter
MTVILGLIIILLAVLALPFFVRKVEEQLELFLFVIGALAVTVSAQWSKPLIHEILLEPMKITVMVLVAGIGFKFLQKPLAHRINRIMERTGIRPFVFLVIVVLGFLSSIITAIITALLLSEIISHMKLDKKNEIKLVVISCFSIGLGAALTPLGEPLSTITIAKLRGAPHYADFWFLLRHLWMFIAPAILLLGVLGVLLINTPVKRRGLSAGRDEDIKDVFLRTGKVYIFIAGLVMLGTGYKPLIDRFISKIPALGLYWINILSAVLDNATLAAVEIGPAISLAQIKSAILGLIISGGMLIPGNIPNIISAGKLKIRSAEWARIGLPLGLGIMAVFFIVLIIFVH